ncbi:P-loop containing nucleoside triphosphate hydrolase protein [Hypoxylon sp. FL1284]|nr:P-loop containing nucleoside triphosphate hydrolase protein [Hypoxylon sp. FL1284]
MSLSSEDDAKLREHLSQCRYDQVATIALCGPKGAGKLSLLRRRTFGMLDDDDEDQLTQSLWQKREYLHGAWFCVRWTTHIESQEPSDPAALHRHVAEADGCLLVYDAASKDSLAGLKQLYETIQGPLHVGDKRKPVVVVANKIDLVRETEELALKEGVAFAESIESILVKTSAIDAIGFRDMLVEALSRMVLAWISAGKRPS